MSTCLRIAIVAAVATAATGCWVGDPYTPPDDSGGGGLTIQWSSRPEAIPSTPSSDRTIDRAVFRQDDLRLVGDAGTFPLDRDKLTWERGIVPTPLPVMGAAPGLYSRLLFELDGSDGSEEEYAYEITGTVKVNDTFQPFTIRDTSDLALSLEFSIMLTAGQSAIIPVRIEIDKMAGAVNFQSVSMVDGRYLVDKDSSQISAVRAAVRDAIGVHDAVTQ